MTRSAERTSVTHVRRDDGVELSLPSHTPLHRLPHDLAHFVVERALGLTTGFWGSIAKGGLLGGMRIAASRNVSARERSRQVMKHAGSQLTEAEALVGTVVKIYKRRLQNDWPVAQGLLEATWRPARPSRALPTRAEILRLCQALAEAEEGWLSIPIGKSVTLVWPERAAGRRRPKPRQAGGGMAGIEARL